MHCNFFLSVLWYLTTLSTLLQLYRDEQFDPELASGWGLTSRGLTNCYRITITGSWGRLLVYTTTYMDQTVRHDITAIMLKVSLNTITHLKRNSVLMSSVEHL
jgi:hypothetical protein